MAGRARTPVRRRSVPDVTQRLRELIDICQQRGIKQVKMGDIELSFWGQAMAVPRPGKAGPGLQPTEPPQQYDDIGENPSPSNEDLLYLSAPFRPAPLIRKKG